MASGGSGEAKAAGQEALVRLMRWYHDQCNGEWEHQYGVTIESLDNPGWSVKIDTVGSGTPLANLPKEFVDYESELDWMVIWVEDGVFRAAGGPRRLSDMLRRFLELVGA